MIKKMKKLTVLLLAMIFAATGVFPVFAANFTKSVEQKPAPSIVTVKTSDGKDAAAIIYDKDGNEIGYLTMDDIIVTPVSNRQNAAEDIKNSLEDTYNEIKNAKSLSELVSGLETQLKKITDKVKATDLVVSDLFDVKLPTDIEEKLRAGEITLKIRFDVGVKKDELLMVMVKCDDKWELIAQENVQNNGDGTVDVTFDKFCPVAFIKDSASVNIDPNGPSSPQTSDINTTPVAVAAALILIGACAMFVIKGKSRKADF